MLHLLHSTAQSAFLFRSLSQCVHIRLPVCLSACLSVCSSECCCKDAICFATPFCLSFCGLLAPANYQNKIVGNKNVYNCATTGERGVESGERETGRDASGKGEGMLWGLAAAANTADACLSAASGGSEAASKAVVEERAGGRRHRKCCICKFATRSGVSSSRCLTLFIGFALGV